MVHEADIIGIDSTPHASPVPNSEADHAGACFSRPLSSLDIAKRLIDKGLVAPSIDELTTALDFIGHYRLRGYWMTFEQENQFKNGTHLNQILEIYDLDRELSAFLLFAIAPIEIALRSRISSILAHHYGAGALHHPKAFKDQNDFERLQLILEKETLQAIKVRKPFALHNINEYGQLPIWIEMENTTLGTLSRIFENLSENNVATEIAQQFKITRSHLKSWLRYLTQIRNSCAHHDRLYNRMFCILPKLFKEHSSINSTRLFPAFIVLFRLHDALDVKRANLLRAQLGRILDSHPSVDLKPIGFPKDWRIALSIPSPEMSDSTRPRGKNGGRPTKNPRVVEQALYLYDMRQGTVTEIAQQCGISLSTLYKYINQRKNSAQKQTEYAIVDI